jgi:nicotinamidase/pyrazinamidase
MKALILVDIHNDFLPGGALPVKDGDAIIPVVNKLQNYFDVIVATQDWHPHNHQSFASNHPGKKIYDEIYLHGIPQTLWPDHCVQGRFGADFPHALNQNKIEAILRKGTNPEMDSYSGFYDNGHLKATGLAGYLRDKNIDEVYLVGLAGDICVYYTAMDSLREKFKTFIIEDATRPLSRQVFDETMDLFVSQGGNIIQSMEIIAV